VKFSEFEQKWKRGSAPKDVCRMRDKVSEKRKVEKSFVEDIVNEIVLQVGLWRMRLFMENFLHDRKSQHFRFDHYYNVNLFGCTALCQS